MIIPSLIATNQNEFDERFNKISAVTDVIHIDIMDGEFVSNHSLDFEFFFEKSKTVEMHLMVCDPIFYLFKHAKKADMFIFQVEVDDTQKIIDSIKAKSKKVGLAINPQTPVEDLEPFLQSVDQVTVMTVIPGQYGSPFIPEMLEKVRWIRERNKTIDIECDGHMSIETIPLAKRAGATKFIAGSVLQQSNNVPRTISELREAEEMQDGK